MSSLKEKANETLQNNKEKVEKAKENKKFRTTNDSKSGHKEEEIIF